MAQRPVRRVQALQRKMPEREKETFTKPLAWEGTRSTVNPYCGDRTSGEWKKVGHTRSFIEVVYAKNL